MNRAICLRNGPKNGKVQSKSEKMPSSNGPVSGNPVGVYEGGFHRLFLAASRQTEWNSFNVGEFIFPQSRLSLSPLIAVCGGLLGWALSLARQTEGTRNPSAEEDGHES